MKKMILLALAFAISIPTALFAQDDIYQTKAKKVSKKSLYADAASDVWSTNANDDWDVDAYNRRGKIDTSTLDKDGYAASSQKTKVIIEDDDKTVHNDTVIEIITLDAYAPYTWSYRIRRFHNIVFNVIVDPWYNGFNYWGWNPWYGTWNYAYYDPFYNPWAWSGWHGYWDPWYHPWGYYGPSWYYDPFYHSNFNVVHHQGHFAHNRPSSHRHPEHNRVGRDNYVGGHSNGSMASTRSRNRGGDYATRSNGTHRSSATRGGGTSGYTRGAGSNGYTRPSSTRGTSSANGNSGYTRQSNRSGSNSNVGGYNGHSRGSSVSRSGNSSSHSSSSGSYSSPSRSSSSSGSYSGGGGYSGGGYSGGGSRGGGGGGGSHSSGGSRSGGGGRR